MNKMTITVTTPDGRKVSHESTRDGSIFDSRVCPASFWTRVAEALDLPGDRELVAVSMRDRGLRTEFGPRPDMYLAFGEVGFCCGERTAPTHVDYTKNKPVYCRIETLTDYSVRA